MIFYDINLEVDGKVPRANSTSLIKSSTSNNTIPSSKENVNENSEKFSMRENVEEIKDLIAVHNMQTSELEKSLALGGLPMPSIAIIITYRDNNV